MGVGIGAVGDAVGGPAGMGNPHRPFQGFFTQEFFQGANLARGFSD